MSLRLRTQLPSRFIDLDATIGRVNGNDHGKIGQIFAQRISKDHPASIFTWGNAKSLKTIPEEVGHVWNIYFALLS
jgi:hypothetical protein